MEKVFGESPKGRLKKNLRTFEDDPFIGEVMKGEGKERRKNSKRNIYGEYCKNGAGVYEGCIRNL